MDGLGVDQGNWFNDTHKKSKNVACIQCNNRVWNSVLEFFSWLDGGRYKEKKTICVMVMWSVWQARNNLLWNKVKETSKQVVNRATKILHHWQAVQKAPMVSVLNNDFEGGATTWETPNEGCLKINVDAACFNSTPRTGRAVVVRDHRGGWITAVTNTRMEKLDPVVAEAWALLEALSWIKDCYRGRIVVEVDCLQIVKLLKTEIHPISTLCCFLFDCVSILETLDNVKVRFVYRSANRVACHMARATNSMPGRRDWSDDPPCFISDVLLADLN
ncbi:uncharacterized protein LOC126672150 [Mercurialis annua]|uniref:uncharacterized protein LOC126672150 n=1 Tax=Mercurialis annua TaxID=3986 RepID=UPI0021604892|nr:uncharacterized protein LOC126672150 [Mercurialis annua]